MNKIPTAEELVKQYDSHIVGSHLTRVSAAAKELTRLHVEAALKAAFSSLETNDKLTEDSILNAYPLTNIV